MLQSRFHVGKKTLNDFYKFSDFFFTHRGFDRSFYRTIFYCPLIYMRLTICSEDLLCSTHKLQGLALKQQLLFLFGCFVTSVFVSGCIQTFTTASRCCRFHRHQPLHHLLSLIAAFHSLTSASPAVACHSVIYFAFLSPLSASYM